MKLQHTLGIEFVDSFHAEENYRACKNMAALETICLVNKQGSYLEKCAMDFVSMVLYMSHVYFSMFILGYLCINHSKLFWHTDYWPWVVYIVDLS
jgi:hypothetical protein